MKLHLEDIRIRDNAARGLSIDGCIYVSIHDTYFPSYQWFDMISVDFENWIPDLISFANGHTDFVILRFVDGPYQIKLCRTLNDSVFAHLCEDQKQDITMAINFSEFLSSVAKCLNQLGTAIYANDPMRDHVLAISRLGATAKALRSLL